MIFSGTKPLELAIRIAAMVVALIGLVVTVAWLFDIPSLKTVYPGAVSMKFSTSISFVCTGIATYFIVELLSSSRSKMSAVSQLVLPAALLIIILFVSVHITSAALGRSSGIDNLFVSETSGTPHTTVPGRPSEATIASFMLIAAAGMVALRRPSSSKISLSAIGLTISAIGGLAILGHVASVPMLYYAVINISTGMAIHTAFLFTTIGVCLFLIAKIQKNGSDMNLGRQHKRDAPMSIRTKFTGMLLIVSVIPILFVGGITLNNALLLPAELLAGSVAVLGFATAISVTFFAFSLSSSLLAPLLSLRNAIHEVAIGNYGVDTAVESTDEIGSLAEDFEQMKSKIVKANDNLERLVNLRTAELLLSKKQLEIVVDQLKEQERIMKNFINVAAHELKNPVAPILMAAQIFAKREVDNKITLSKSELDLIAQNAIRLKRLCENILDVARIESNGINLEKSRFNLSELLQRSITDSKPMIRPGVEVLFAGPDQVVEADHDKLEQVIQNLLHNAIKFTHHGAIQVSLAMTSNCEVAVTVKDSGDGIDSEMIPRLFSKYATKSEKGTGLGLFIAKNIVEAHGGRIWAENNPGNGATFAFSLPLSQVAVRETNEMA